MSYPYQNGYNQYPQFNQTYQPQMFCRMVSSREEAAGIPVDFSGNLMVFVDRQNNQIYTKRWDEQRGATAFGVFAPVPQQPQNSQEQNPIMQMLGSMQQQISDIWQRIAQKEGAENE